MSSGRHAGHRATAPRVPLRRRAAAAGALATTALIGGGIAIAGPGGLSQASASGEKDGPVITLTADAPRIDIGDPARVKVALSRSLERRSQALAVANDPANAPLSTEPCPDSSIERGLKHETVLVYRAVCHAFPEVTEYAGIAGRREHNTGNAIDIMVYGDKELGDRIAAWALAHQDDFDLFDILWFRHIWTPVRAREGWRSFGNRGSRTANHEDHVHIGTN